MTEALAWLAANHRGAPARLGAAMARALARVPDASSDGSVAEVLAEAGLAALAGVVRGPGNRPSALELLAADALLTAACHAAAEDDPRALEALTRRLSPDRFADLLTGARA